MDAKEETTKPQVDVLPVAETVTETETETTTTTTTMITATKEVEEDAEIAEEVSRSGEECEMWISPSSSPLEMATNHVVEEEEKGEEMEEEKEEEKMEDKELEDKEQGKEEEMEMEIKEEQEEDKEQGNEEVTKMEEVEQEEVEKEEKKKNEEEDEEYLGNWHYMPDTMLLSIFQYLSPKELLTAGEACKTWNRVSQDELLWKVLFYRTYKVDPSVGIMPGKFFFHLSAIHAFGA